MEARKFLWLPLLCVLIFFVSSVNAANLVAYWPMDGDATDASGNGHDGTAVGSPTYETGPKGSLAVSLNGTTDYFVVGGDANDFKLPDSIAIMGWMKSPADTGGVDSRTILGRGTGADDGWAVHRYVAQNRIDFYTVGDNVPDGGDPFDDTWHHIAFAAADGTKTLYIDGVEAASGTFTTMGDNPNNRDLLIGNNPESMGRFWNGGIDELIILDDAVNAADVQLIMNEGLNSYFVSASFPYPDTGAAKIKPLELTLSWQLPEPAVSGDTVTCDVLFGTDPNMIVDTTLLVNKQAVESVVAPTLSPETTYYWRVDCYDPQTPGPEVKTVGKVWSFSTGTLGRGLVAYWPFDGNADDASGNGYDARTAGTPSFIAGQFGNAASLNGTTDYFWFPITDANDFSLPTSVTIATWIKSPVNAGGQNFRTIIGRGTGTDDGWALHRHLQENRINFYTVGAATLMDPYGADPFDDTWHHVALTAANGTKILYYDGVQVTSIGYSTMGENINNRDIYIGNNSEDPTRFWDGELDDLVVFNQALTADDIVAIKENGVNAFLTQASNPIPENGATAIEPTTLTSLSWQLPAAFESGDIVSCDVLFGTDPTMVVSTLLVNKSTVESVALPTLDASTTYYWRVDVYDPRTPGPEVKTTGTVWSFTTGALNCDPATAPDGDLDLNCVVDLRDFALLARNWLDCTLIPASACP